MKCLDIVKAREAYANGGNVTEMLRRAAGNDANTSDIIEIAYDLQAGSYVEDAIAHMDSAKMYVQELAELISPYLSPEASLLDVGTGELTTYALLHANPIINAKQVFAFDISWSRLHNGMAFWTETTRQKPTPLSAFVADMSDIPLASKSIDVVTSSHALEPNGGSLDHLLAELFRICRGHLILFEPSYELNSPEGKARMDRLGYIKDIEGAVNRLGAVLDRIVPIQNVRNPLNPTHCYVIKPPEGTASASNASQPFAVPGTDYPLVEREGFFVSCDTGLAFPILKGIPILKPSSGILATSLWS